MATVKVVRRSVKSNPPAADTGCSCTSGGCCGGAAAPDLTARYVTGSLQTPAGIVPQISTGLAMSDRFGALKVRLNIGRMDYKVKPGLYCVGNPDENAPVLATANYKLTFDSLRKELQGLSVWLLVLDTKGVNVWCAAGKGTFGTDELVRRIEAAGLGQVVKHRTIILPQLGATGVSAHEAAKRSGFHVVYGPVRASDIKAFLDAGMKATPGKRAVRFTLANRAVLAPVELVQAIKPLVILFGIMFILNVLGLARFGATELAAFFGAAVTGCVLTPVLLPWIPGRAFSFKGALLGLLWAVGIMLLSGGFMHAEYLKAIAFLLLLPSISAYAAMNFTGSSTYTSPSGVGREMRVAIPAMLTASICGCVLLLADSVMKTIF